MAPAALVVLATSVSLASICVGADGHVNLELRLWAHCGDVSGAPSAAWEYALSEASPCCGACLHVGGDDDPWLAAELPAAKRSPVSSVLEHHRRPVLQDVASHFLAGLAHEKGTARGLASIVIRC